MYPLTKGAYIGSLAASSMIGKNKIENTEEKNTNHFFFPYTRHEYTNAVRMCIIL